MVRIRASQFCSEGKGFNFKGFETALAELFSQFASMKTKAESFPDVKNTIMIITTTSASPFVALSVCFQRVPERSPTENCGGHERAYGN
jgi:hypothetical protein